MNDFAGRYLKFTKVVPPKPRKTDVFRVAPVTDDKMTLGAVLWHSPWRRYVFATACDASPIFDSACLHEIQTFIHSLMAERK